jgi:hypothetical protein
MKSDKKLTPAPTVVLTVRNKANTDDVQLTLPGPSDISSVHFDEITPALLRERAPDMIVSMAFTTEFDCLDLAMILQACGYLGRYRAIAAGLPAPGLVIKEVSSLCPALDFDILDAAPRSAQYTS